MKILFVSSGNSGGISPFVNDQSISLIENNIEVEMFMIVGSGILGYLGNRTKLMEKIKSFQPDILHAHYGLSGLLCVLQNKIPVVVTFHGDDINIKSNRFMSYIPLLLSHARIYVSKRIESQVKFFNGQVIPCGVDFEIFKPMNKANVRAELGFGTDEKIVLFSSAFDRLEKNSSLAIAAVKIVKSTFPDVKLLELKGYSREMVAKLLNVADVALLTSIREASPQFVKEALAVNCPLVATPVGDIVETTASLPGCFITSYDPNDVADKIILALDYGKTSTRDSVRHLDSNLIAQRIIKIYNEILR